MPLIAHRPKYPPTSNRISLGSATKCIFSLGRCHFYFVVPNPNLTMVVQVSKLKTVAPLASWWCCREPSKLSTWEVFSVSETVHSNPNPAHGDPSLQVANRRALDVQVVLRRDTEVEPLPRTLCVRNRRLQP